jgi:uncharacterized protein (DUF885 family)
MRNLLAALSALLLAGCAGPSPTTSVADAEFEKLAAEYINGYLAWRPQQGTALGLHEYDGRLTDFSKASLATELARLKSFARRLHELSTARLSPRASRDYRILNANVQREIFGFQQMRNFTQNPMTYAGALDVNIYIKRNFAPLPDRVRSVIAILGQAPTVMRAARENLEPSLPHPHIEVAILQAIGAADFLSGDLVAAVRSLEDKNLLAQFEATNRLAIEQLRGFAEWLRKEKLPKAHEQYSLGRDQYVEMLRAGEMVTLSPEQLLARGVQELHHTQGLFVEAAKQVDGSKPAIEVFKAIQRDHPTEQNLIPDTARDLEKIRQFVVDHRIVSIPSPVRALVREMPQYLRATGFASMDTPGPFETRATQAYYYVTPPEPDWSAQQKEEWLTAFNYYTTEVVSIHEAYPGHYVQFLCLNASPANRLQKIFSSYAFVEGWAHYAEQMMLEQGYGSVSNAAGAADGVRAAKYRLAQLDEALLRLCRFCVSIRMHCEGMTVEEATAFFRENCYYEEKPARQEALRGAYDPEYLYYTLGKLQLLKLREDYRRQEGSSFNLQAFHDQILRHGAPQFRLLREILLRDPAAWEQVL